MDDLVEDDEDKAHEMAVEFGFNRKEKEAGMRLQTPSGTFYVPMSEHRILDMIGVLKGLYRRTVEENREEDDE